jgi:ADP-ribose pyrophosphatase YjhB (NUDIX family)
MCREFLEETGISTTTEQWAFFGSHQKSAQYHLDEQAYSMYLFSTILTPDQMAQLSQPTEEEPKWLTLNDLASLLYNGVGGVLMYVTMAYNHYGKSFNTMTIETPT